MQVKVMSAIFKEILEPTQNGDCHLQHYNKSLRQLIQAFKFCYFFNICYRPLFSYKYGLKR